MENSLGLTNVWFVQIHFIIWRRDKNMSSVLLPALQSLCLLAYFPYFILLFSILFFVRCVFFFLSPGLIYFFLILPQSEPCESAPQPTHTPSGNQLQHGRPSCEFCPQNSLTTSSRSLRLNFTLNADMTYRKCQAKTSRRRLWWLFFGQDLHTDVTFMISVALIPRESGVKYRWVHSDVINDGRACCAETKAGAASLSTGATFSRLPFYFALGCASHAGRVSVDRLSTAALHIVFPTTGLHDELFLKMRLLPWKHVIHHISLCPSLGL